MSEVKTVSTNMEDFKELQQRLNHESIKFQFRTKLVGGLEQEHNRELNEIFSLREILNREIQEKKNLQENLDNAQTLNETNAAEIAQMQNLIKQMSEEKEHLQKQLNDSNLIVEHLKICGAGFEENYNLLKFKST